MLNRENIIAKEFVVGLDYDGVITKRGSSGLNEEKWKKREANVIWRKTLNFVSLIYNKCFSLNKEIIELTRILKEDDCKIIIITSHTLTTSNYKESIQTKNRVKKRLAKHNILYDDIIFIDGDKVDICKALGVNLMVEDNIMKVEALREAGINTLIKKTDKNEHQLDTKQDIVDNLLEVVNIVRKEKESISDFIKTVNIYSSLYNEKKEKYHNKQIANFLCNENNDIIECKRKKEKPMALTKRRFNEKN